MGRKGKRPGGNFPLTHYERTKKFASSEYGTTSKRLAGHSQYQLGDCALSLTRLITDTDIDTHTALCSPSGYLYSQDAILEYLLTKTQELKEQQVAYDRQQAQAVTTQSDERDQDDKKRLADFQESQKVVKKRQVVDAKEAALTELKRTSYWLADAQPGAVTPVKLSLPPTRPLSPITQEPLRRKDLWPVALQWQENKLVCAISGKSFQTQTAATVYWTDKTKPGTLVLTDIYKQLLEGPAICPNTNRKIKYTRELQQSGSSFANSEQTVQAKKYRPTIT
jgi:nitric oxide synthase-interacting protein